MREKDPAVREAAREIFDFLIGKGVPFFLKRVKNCFPSGCHPEIIDGVSAFMRLGKRDYDYVARYCKDGQIILEVGINPDNGVYSIRSPHGIFYDFGLIREAKKSLKYLAA